MITNYISNMEVLQPLTELLPVHEGFSDDLKFVAVINRDNKIFIRACNLAKSTQKQEEMSIMKVLRLVCLDRLGQQNYQITEINQSYILPIRTTLIPNPFSPK
jgi:hypothetical protein